MLKLYGHYGSQPFRSVAWLLKIKAKPFEVVKINPLAGEARTKEYRSKFPLGLIPALEDTDHTPSFTLSEGSAILIYLCEKYGWNDFYPCSLSTNSVEENITAMKRRAKVLEYVSHHNESTRKMTHDVIFPSVKWIFGNDANSRHDVNDVKPIVQNIAKRFQHKFLLNKSCGDYIVEGDHPTIADLMAYEDLAQVQMMLGIQYTEWEELQPLQKWIQKMSDLPCHDDVHRTVYKIGDLYQSKL